MSLVYALDQFTDHILYICNNRNAERYLPPANEVCQGYVFTRVCNSVHRMGCLGPGPGWRLGGLARGGCPGPYPRGGGGFGGVWSGGMQAHTWGEGCPGPGGCTPACTEADTPPQQMATAAVRILRNTFLFLLIPFINNESLLCYVHFSQLFL